MMSELGALKPITLALVLLLATPSPGLEGTRIQFENRGRVQGLRLCSTMAHFPTSP